MRHVDLNKLAPKLPETWAATAEAAFGALKGLDADARKEKIKGAPKWQELRKTLGDFLKGKCWYCESVIRRSHKPVDHFRPKANVIEAPAQGGYWWLAYEWRNYRFACTHCNTLGTAASRGKEGGKNDHFPIRDEANRALGPRVSKHHPDPIDSEEPILLDPASPTDFTYLWFNEDGTVIPHPRLCSDKDSLSYRRSDQSIKIYGLYQDELNESRGTYLKTKIKPLLQRADDLLIKANAGNATAKQEHDARIQELRDAFDIYAEYSSAVRCFLMAERGTSRSAEIALS